ncbi:MAG: hypothetical protein RLZZ422_2640 [Pseudomonadota bacterium]|jgi:death-on-curing protein
MSQPIWVLPTVVLQVHQLLIDEHGGTQGLRDQGLLDSALARPEHSLNAPEPEAVTIFEQLAAGHLTESSLAQWFEHSSTPHFPY